MSWYDAIRLPKDVAEGDDPRVLDVMVDHAASFLAAGGMLMVGDWAMMGPTARAAFVQAGKVLELEREATRAMAAEGPDGLARVMKDMGDSEQWERVCLTRAARKALAKHGIG